MKGVEVDKVTIVQLLQEIIDGGRGVNGNILGISKSVSEKQEEGN